MEYQAVKVKTFPTLSPTLHVDINLCSSFFRIQQQLHVFYSVTSTGTKRSSWKGMYNCNSKVHPLPVETHIPIFYWCILLIFNPPDILTVTWTSCSQSVMWSTLVRSLGPVHPSTRDHLHRTCHVRYAISTTPTRWASPQCTDIDVDYQLEISRSPVFCLLSLWAVHVSNRQCLNLACWEIYMAPFIQWAGVQISISLFMVGFAETINFFVFSLRFLGKISSFTLFCTDLLHIPALYYSAPHYLTQ